MTLISRTSTVVSRIHEMSWRPPFSVRVTLLWMSPAWARYFFPSQLAEMTEVLLVVSSFCRIPFPP